MFFFPGFVAVVMATIAEFMMAFAKVDWILYLSGLVAFLNPCSTTCARANITKLVSPFEIGATFAVVGAFQVSADHVPPGLRSARSFPAGSSLVIPCLRPTG